MDAMPKKEALKDIIQVMKKLKVEKMKAYNKTEDEEPAMEMEMHKLDKEKAKKLKDKLRDMFTSEED